MEISIQFHCEDHEKDIPSKYLINKMNIVHNEIMEPKNYNEAVSSPLKDEWINAIQEEMVSLNILIRRGILLDIS